VEVKDIEKIVTASALIMSSTLELLNLTQRMVARSKEISEADRETLISQIEDIRGKVNKSKFDGVDG